MMDYTPKKIQRPSNILDVPSAWRGIESIIGDIITHFNIGTHNALEFGVEYGYSTVALSNFFTEVVGVDTFEGDKHTYDKNMDGLYEIVKELMPKNVKLIQSKYQDYKDDTIYDLIHVDIVHTYEDTYACGDWAMQHASCVIFHDTQSFNEVSMAVNDLAKKYGVIFHNYPFHHGLGILCHKSQS